MASKWVTVQTRGLTDDTMCGGLYKKFSLICLLLFFSHEVFSKVCISLDCWSQVSQYTLCGYFYKAFVTSNVEIVGGQYNLVFVSVRLYGRI